MQSTGYTVCLKYFFGEQSACQNMFIKAVNNLDEG